MAKYKLLSVGSPTTGVLDTETGATIPNNSENRHWKRYLAWVDLGNTSDPADVFVEDWDNRGRILRDQKLLATDWTQLPDSPLTTGKKAEWATYRQELRDLPTTYIDYSTVVWPTEPN
jgi:hypothetical protein